MVFADLAGFTALSDQTALEELGAVAGRFEALAGEVAVRPARLVKVLGDGAMYVGDAAAVLETVLALVAVAEQRGLPPVHAGIAWGPALRTAGDWYGRTVNLAARLCDVATPRTALVTHDLLEAAGELGAGHTERGPLRIRGLDEPAVVYELGTAAEGRRTAAGAEARGPRPDDS